jgi:Skp family chaperone for outer membrane proteins
MGRRITLGIIAVLSSVVGGFIVYLLLSVPNDVRAEQLLRQARDDIKQSKTTEARTKLQQIVADYPRTDAAAAASSALFRLDNDELAKIRTENERLAAELKKLQQARVADAARLKTVEEKTAELAKPAPAPPPPVVKKPAPVKKKAPAKKPVKRTTRRRR